MAFELVLAHVSVWGGGALLASGALWLMQRLESIAIRYTRVSSVSLCLLYLVLACPWLF